MPKSFSGEMSVISTHSLGKIAQSHAKEWSWILNLLPVVQKSTQNEAKTLRLLKKNKFLIYWHLHDIEFSNSMDRKSIAQTTKEKNRYIGLYQNWDISAELYGAW